MIAAHRGVYGVFIRVETARDDLVQALEDQPEREKLQRAVHQNGGIRAERAALQQAEHRLTDQDQPGGSGNGCDQDETQRAGHRPALAVLVA